jgi:hypothetical protein
MAQGQGFIIDNDSSGTLALQDGSTASLGSVTPGMAVYVFCENNSTTAGSWSGYMFVPGGGPGGQVTWGTTGLSMGGQAITNANWNGTAVSILYGGTNASTASITSFNNITGYSAAGATGTTSTNLVFSTSPTLVTPTLGAALATSIKFGSSTVLSDYEEGTWTPAVGNQTVVGTFSSNGTYTKIGRQVFFRGQVIATTSISGAAGSYIRGLPFTSTASGTGSGTIANQTAGAIIFIGPGDTNVYIIGGYAATGNFEFSGMYFAS